MAGKMKPAVSAAPVAEGARFSVGTATAFAVRREGKDIALRIRREKRPFRRAMRRIPFLRGMQRLLLSVAGGLDGISESFELEPQRIVKGNRAEQAFARLFRIHPESLVGFLSGVAILLLIGGLAVGAPLAVQTRVLPRFQLTRAWINAIVCTVRILGVLLALPLCARLRLVNRLCMYRGAINKVLNASESRRHATDIDIEDAMEASRIYRASDAAFLTVVAVVSIAVFAMIRTFTLPIQLLVRALTLFVVAAVVNEPIHALESMKPGHPLRWLRAPYLWLERMFVIEPHRQMVEVALCAFNAARENDL